MDLSFKDLDKLDVFSKTTIISILVLMPFWYATLYLFHKQFYLTSDINIKITFSFCFSITWYFINIAFLIIENSIMKRNFDLKNLFNSAGFLSVCFLSMNMLFFFDTTSTYKGFLVRTFGWLTIFYISAITVNKIFSKRKKNVS